MNQTFQRRPARSGAIPDVIFAILIVNGVMFAAQNIIDGRHPDGALAIGPIAEWLALWGPGTGNFMPWQLLTYGFLHANVMHILFNMFMLWMFGRELEVIMGPRRFLTYYLVCVGGAGLVQLLFGGNVTIGASGGVFGILLAFGMAFPNRMILLLFPPIPMKAKYLVVLAGLMELYFGVSGSAPGIANFAHLGGMVFGFALLMYWRRRARR